ncbi:hypothetical protein [Planctomycetes bacterium K23_9]|uniref:Uncharacterized protein n=1 Tax=Stieleria marina TaxID=1930275 RepID=A0A517P2L2_9BACT|nr:hypothetical protein K239x_56310 [Planctomycetes bacterium K23_9]
MSSPAIEQAIRQIYVDHPAAVEPILTSRVLREDFVRSVQHLVAGATEDEVLQHLVRLRKRGADKGGLPRKTK